MVNFPRWLFLKSYHCSTIRVSSLATCDEEGYAVADGQSGFEDSGGNGGYLGFFLIAAYVDEKVGALN